ncbi:hypothetical protein [Clostridium sp.]|uniref:hypothetical protein n=1 Tax=Clostridium sp. TaxID=1506 RepID=UPI002FCADF31
MKKSMYFIIGVVMVAILILGYNYNKYATKDFQQTLSMNPNKITTIKIENPTGENDDFISTTDKDKIEELVNYLNKFEFKRKSTDAIDAKDLYPNMDVNTSTLMLYQNDKVNIITPVGKEIMINEKAFTVVNGEIDFTFIMDFYKSIKK